MYFRAISRQMLLQQEDYLIDIVPVDMESDNTILPLETEIQTDINAEEIDRSTRIHTDNTRKYTRVIKYRMVTIHTSTCSGFKNCRVCHERLVPVMDTTAWKQSPGARNWLVCHRPKR